MKKEKGLYVMDVDKGAILKKANFDNELTFESSFDLCIINGQPIAAQKIDDDFLEHQKTFALALAKFLSQRGSEIKPVIVEFDIKVTGLDGTEYNIDEIQSNVEDDSDSELAKLLGLLAKRN